MDYTRYQWGPSHTPKVITALILITSIASVLSSLLNHLFHLFQLIGPIELFALSWYGLKHYFLWQPLTFSFISASEGGIDLFYLIALAFNMYILWAFGTSVQERTKTVPFLFLYLGSGILAGIAAWLFMPILGQYPVISGSSAAILTLFVVWSMLYPDSNLMLFMILPIQTKWLLAGVLGAIVLSCISQLDFLSLIFYFVAVCWGYVFSVVLLEQKSPFDFTHPLDRTLNQFGNYLRGESTHSIKPKSKIFDFKSGEPILSDEVFIDEMLTKISKYGERALTETERQRMQKISERKMKEK